MENVNIPILSYADTSVFGGVFDEGFDETSKAFFQQVKEKRFKLVISPIVQKEIELAPENVRQFFDEITESADFIAISEEALLLRQAYLDAGIVTQKSTADALHVALATVAKCQLIVSWNFKHIVHFQKVPLYRAINTIKGYKEINIYSPPEVIDYESETI
jgi:predicted nucleic acid-binding protein